MAYTLLVRNCGELLTMDTGRPNEPLRGRALRDWHSIPNGYVACEQDRIVALGPMAELDTTQLTPATTLVDAAGQVVLPGLVECHTHLVFGGNRAGEFQRKLQGESYLDILAGGGGILSTVRATRAATPEALLDRALHHLAGFRRYGVTTLEAKSGYGLDAETELCLLEVARAAGRQQPVRVVPTFLGAHVPGPEYHGRPTEYLDMLATEVLPHLNPAAVPFVDIFCEQGAFSVADARRYLTRARELGFGLKIHAEQLHELGGCEMAAALGAVSIDHCDYLSPAGAARVAAVSGGRTVAVLLPLVPLFLRQEQYAPGRAFIEAGLPVALSTDFNPGSCPSKNLWLAVSVACLKMGFTPREALAAVTCNAAWAIGQQQECGSLARGKRADLLVLNVPTAEEIPYWLGENPVQQVIIGGQLQSA
ncbi:imidazolonepropionase [Hymenobacter sp. HSC-4F20]|uniref:imidazolonepropionase n=1 Tax=Hymenobacter sp. HSC-4F20 TaxID=2864135 RepID=UPI001C72F84F|nr:imidazolonepropionase [Hymenobacter sp. HSC-4F20]MBX0290318.1 imidazolonepropionase [Hymenobacter sp. HSC-4F20]